MPLEICSTCLHFKSQELALAECGQQRGGNAGGRLPAREWTSSLCPQQPLKRPILDTQELALDAVNTVAVTPTGGGQREIDIKKYIKVEKIPGGSVEDCRVLKGVMFNKVRFRLCQSEDGCLITLHKARDDAGQQRGGQQHTHRRRHVQQGVHSCILKHIGGLGSSSLHAHLNSRSLLRVLNVL